MSRLERLALNEIVIGILIIIFSCFILFFGESEKVRFICVALLALSGLTVSIGGLVFFSYHP